MGKQEQAKSSRPVKTNAMRALEQRRVAYEVYTYPPELHSADVVAAALSLAADEVYKTLVVLREPRQSGVRDKPKPLLVMIAGDRELELRHFAREIGEKRVQMASKVEAERLTGLLVGGIGALALLNRGFDVFLDRRALERPSILVNGGQRGLNLRVEVADLMTVTGARLVAATIGGDQSADGSAALPE